MHQICTRRDTAACAASILCSLVSLLLLARGWCRYGVESKCSFTTGNGTEYKVFDAGELLLPLRHQHHRLDALRLLPLLLRRCSRSCCHFSLQAFPCLPCQYERETCLM